MDDFPGLVHWVSDFNADGSLPPSETLLTYTHIQLPTFLLEFTLMPAPEKEEYEAWKQ